MGNDGGTIPRRVELVREKQRPKQADKDSGVAAKWKHCQISQEPLRQPVVACDLGRLYNKDAVLHHLLDKKSHSSVADHVKSIKDVCELKLTVAAGSEEAEKSTISYEKIPCWICPVTGLEMNGHHPFSFLRTCGCVVSERALKALKSETCPSCNSPQKHGDEDIIPLNPPPEELDRLRRQMHLRRERDRAEKKAKKRPLEPNEAEAGPSAPKARSGQPSKTAKSAASRDADVQRIQNRSIATDPAASEVFKSLFTSSETAKQRDHAHWVTYNPFYN